MFNKILINIVFYLSILATPTFVMAGDFDWLKELNLSAVNDPDGFKARLAARFKIGDAQVSTVISNVSQPADAYMVLRLGEITGRSTREVMDTYKIEGQEGWGVMARAMGIKPGSLQFHELKKGSDLNGAATPTGHKPDKNKAGNDRDKPKGNGQGKAKNKD